MAALAVLGANRNPLGFITLTWLVLLAPDPVRSAEVEAEEKEPAGMPLLAHDAPTA